MTSQNVYNVKYFLIPTHCVCFRGALTAGCQHITVSYAERCILQARGKLHDLKPDYNPEFVTTNDLQAGHHEQSNFLPLYHETFDDPLNKHQLTVPHTHTPIHTHAHAHTSC